MPKKTIVEKAKEVLKEVKLFVEERNEEWKKEKEAGPDPDVPMGKQREYR